MGSNKVSTGESIVLYYIVYYIVLYRVGGVLSSVALSSNEVKLAIINA